MIVYLATLCPQEKSVLEFSLVMQKISLKIENFS